MKQSKERGLVLLTTLMLILISSLLVLSQMQLLLLNYKELNQFNEKRHFFRDLETAATLISEANLQAECILHEDSPNLAIDLLKRKKGCLFIHEKQPYYYLIEDLGVFPCLQIQREQLSYSTHHLRISLGSMAKYPAVLQIRFARLAKFAQCTQQKPKQGRLGVLSWRVLNVNLALTPGV